MQIMLGSVFAGINTAPNSKDAKDPNLLRALWNGWLGARSNNHNEGQNWAEQLMRSLRRTFFIDVSALQSHQMAMNLLYESDHD